MKYFAEKFSNFKFDFIASFSREKMAQAYDFALDKMGMDILSYPIWNDYINFLKNV